MTGPSGVDPATTAYAQYTVTLHGSDIYTVHPIIPQYYEYLGYKAVTNPGQAQALMPGNAEADYSQGSEWWVTICIQPTGEPGDYEWGWKTNRVGKLG